LLKGVETGDSRIVPTTNLSERSEAEKSVKSIAFGNVHLLFGKNRQKYINIHNKSTLIYFKTSLAAS